MHEHARVTTHLSNCLIAKMFAFEVGSRLQQCSNIANENAHRQVNLAISFSFSSWFRTRLHILAVQKVKINIFIFYYLSRDYSTLRLTQKWKDIYIYSVPSMDSTKIFWFTYNIMMCLQKYLMDSRQTLFCTDKITFSSNVSIYFLFH